MARNNATVRSLLIIIPLVMVVLCRTAWLCDDAYITFRTIDNLFNGYGLTWNVGDRVQTYTHPLWLGLLAGLHTVSGEVFFTTQALSIALTLCVVALVLAGRETRGAGLIGVALLLLSKSFVDYSSSGLENPLSHLLAATYLTVYYRDPPVRSRVTVLAGIAGLAALNRLDTLVIYLPSLVHELGRSGWRVGLKAATIGFAPLAAWEAFSLVYYGFPFPNTAYAKLNTGLTGRADLLADGFLYLGNSFRTDPLTLVTIGLATALSVLQKHRRDLLLAAGALAYLTYVVWIGGDYLSGRFLSTPFVVCAFPIVRHLASSSREVRVPVVSLLVCCGGLSPASPIFSLDANWWKRGYIEIWDRWAIHDERANFWSVASLARARRSHPDLPGHPWADPGKQLRQSGERIHLVDAVGFAGYYAGPRVHLVDRWALGDALLARLPPVKGRVGHLDRVIPDGYIESLRTSSNVIRDPDLAAYYDHLRLVITGDLWSRDRFLSICRLNSGKLQSLIDAATTFRGELFERQMEVRNVTGLPYVTTYVWHKGAAREYLLDDASTEGARYAVDWRITRDGASLAGAHPLLKDTLSGLRGSGSFTVSVAFKEHQGAPTFQVYEQRYTYRARGGMLEVLRAPVEAYTRNVTLDPWHEEPIGDVIRER